MLEFVEFDCSLREYLSKISEEYDTYNSISKVLHGLIDYTSDVIKQRVVDEFIKCIISVDIGNRRKQYIYDPQFTGCNCELNSFDEFMKFYANNVDKYFLIRCVHLFMAYRRLKKGRIAPFLVLGEMSIINNVKRIVKQAEEELSMN